MSLPNNNIYPPYQQNSIPLNQPLTNTAFIPSSTTNQPNFRNTPNNIKQQDAERRKMLLQNIQSQMILNKPSKLQELQKRKEEDQKYIQDMQNCFPFGRGGGGAPIRDKNGTVVTTRRGLISNPKYNLVQLNVDDDYNEVWDKGNKYGMMNYKNTLNRNNNNSTINMNGSNLSQTMGYNNNTNNFNGQYGNSFFANTAQRSLSARIYGNNNNMNNNFNYGMPNGMDVNYQQQQPPFDGYNNDYMNQQQPNQMFNNGIDNNYNAYQNEQQPFYNGSGIDMTQQQNAQPQFINNTPPINNPPTFQQSDPNFNYNNNNPELTLSYDNYDINDYQKQRTKETYRNDLLQQIAEKKQRELLEKQRRAQEEREEEERLIREQEEIDRKKEQELKRQKNDLKNKITVQTPEPILLQPSPPPQNPPPVVTNPQIPITEKQQTSNDNLFQFSQEEMQNRLALNNEVLKLREQMENQQASLYEQINSLRQETQNANMQRYEALQEIDKLKNELNKQRSDEELRRKYIYDVVGNGNENGITSHTHLPESTVERIELPVQDPKSMYYEETMRHPNKILPLPNLNELKENGMKTDSQFIDMDGHTMVSGLELFEPKVKVDDSIESKEEMMKINNKGLSVEGDFGTLRSYYRSDDADGMKGGCGSSMEEGVLEINQIYNKNIERLRYLNDIEGKIMMGDHKGGVKEKTVDNIVKENYDDFINKINQTCTPHY